MRFVSIAKPILTAVLLLTSAQAGAQSKEQKAGARAAAEAGGDAFDAGRYAEAADLYERAERIMHAPPHLLYAARAHLKLGHLVEAREHYLTLTREQLSPNAPRAFRDAQQLGEKELADLEPRLPYVSVVVQGGGGATALRVTRNGQPVPAELLGVPTPVNPGDYSYQAFAEGMESTATSVKLSEGVRETVVLTLRPIPGFTKPKAEGAPGSEGGSASSSLSSRPSDTGVSLGGRPLLYGAIAGFGVAAVGVTVGTIFVLKGMSTKEKADDLCDRGPDGRCRGDKALVDPIDSDARFQTGVGITGYVVGGLGLATGITLLVMDGNRSAVNSARVVPLIGPGFVGARGTF